MTGINIPVGAEDRGAKKQLQELNRNLAKMVTQANLVSKSLNSFDGKRINTTGRQFRKASKDVQDFSQKSTASLRKTGTETERLTKRVNGLITAFGGLATAAGTLFAGKAFSNAGDQVIRYNNALKITTDNLKLVGRRQQDLIKVSREARASLENTIDTYKVLSLSLRNFGASDQQILRVTKTLQKMAALSSGSAESIKSAFVQLNQGLGSELRGQELRAVLEQFDFLGRELRDSLGKTAGELLKFAEAGNLSGKFVFDLLLKLGDKTDREFAKTAATVVQGITQVKDAATLFFGEVSTVYGFTQRSFGLLSNIAQGFDKAGSSLAINVLNFQKSTKAFRSEFDGFGGTIVKIFGEIGKAVGRSVGLLPGEVNEIFPEFYSSTVSVLTDVKKYIFLTFFDIERDVTDSLFKISNKIRSFTGAINPFVDAKNVEIAFSDILRSKSIDEALSSLEAFNKEANKGRRTDFLTDFIGTPLVVFSKLGREAETVLIRLGFVEDSLLRMSRIPLENLANAFRTISRSLDLIFAQNIAPVIRETVGKISTFFIVYKEAFINGLRTVVSTVGAIAGTLAGILVNNFISAIDGAYSLIRKAITGELTGNVIGQTIKDYFFDILEETGRLIEEFATSFSKSFRVSVDSFSSYSITQDILRGFSAVSDLFSDIGKKASSILPKAVRTVQEFTRTIVDAFEWVYEKVIGNSYWTDTVEEVNNLSKKLYKSSDVVRDFSSIVVRTFKKTFDQVAGYVDNFSSILGGVFTSIGNIDFREFITNVTDNIIAAVAAIFAILSSGKGFKFDANKLTTVLGLSFFFAQLGNDVVVGLRDSLNVPSREIESASEKFAFNVITGLKNAFIILSDNIGEIVGGLLSGIAQALVNIPIVGSLFDIVAGSLLNNSTVSKLIGLFVTYQLIFADGLKNLNKKIVAGYASVQKTLIAAGAGVKLAVASSIFAAFVALDLEEILGPVGTIALGGELIGRILFGRSFVTDLTLSVLGMLKKGITKAFAKLSSFILGTNTFEVAGTFVKGIVKSFKESSLGTEVAAVLGTIFSNMGAKMKLYTSGSIGLSQVLFKELALLDGAKGLDGEDLGLFFDIDFSNLFGELGETEIGKVFSRLFSSASLLYNNFKRNLTAMFKGKAFSISELFLLNTDTGEKSKLAKVLFPFDTKDLRETFSRLIEPLKTSMGPALLELKTTFAASFAAMGASIASFARTLGRSVRTIVSSLGLLRVSLTLVAILFSARSFASPLGDAVESVAESFVSLAATLVGVYVGIRLVAGVINLITRYKDLMSAFSNTMDISAARSSAFRLVMSELTLKFRYFLKTLGSVSMFLVRFVALIGGALLSTLAFIGRIVLVAAAGFIQLGAAMLNLKGAKTLTAINAITTALRFMYSQLKRVNIIAIATSLRFTGMAAAFRATGAAAMLMVANIRAGTATIGATIFLLIKRFLVMLLGLGAVLIKPLAIIAAIAAAIIAIPTLLLQLFGDGDDLIDKLALTWDWVRRILGLTEKTRRGRRAAIEDIVPGIREAIEVDGLEIDFTQFEGRFDLKEMSKKEFDRFKEFADNVKGAVEEAEKAVLEGTFTPEARESLRKDAEQARRVFNKQPQLGDTSIIEGFDSTIRAYDEAINDSWFAAVRNWVRRPPREVQLSRALMLAERMPEQLNEIQSLYFKRLEEVDSVSREWEKRLYIRSADKKFIKQVKKATRYDDMNSLLSSNNLLLDQDKILLEDYWNRMREIRDEYAQFLTDNANLLPKGFGREYLELADLPRDISTELRNLLDPGNRQGKSNETLKGEVDALLSRAQSGQDTLLAISEAASVYVAQLQKVGEYISGISKGVGPRKNAIETATIATDTLGLNFGKKTRDYFLSEQSRSLIAELAFYNDRMEDDIDKAVQSIVENTSIDGIAEAFREINRSLEQNRRRAEALFQESLSDRFISDLIGYLSDASDVFSGEDLKSIFSQQEQVPAVLIDSLKTIKSLKSELELVANENTEEGIVAYANIQRLIDNIERSLVNLAPINFSFDVISSALSSAGVDGVEIPILAKFSPDQFMVLESSSRALQGTRIELEKTFGNVSVGNIENQRQAFIKYNKDVERTRLNLKLFNLSLVDFDDSPQKVADQLKEFLGQDIDASIRRNSTALGEYVKQIEELEKIGLALEANQKGEVTLTDEVVESYYQRIEAINAYKDTLKSVSSSEVFDSFKIDNATSQRSFLKSSAFSVSKELVQAFSSVEGLRENATDAQLDQIINLTDRFEIFKDIMATSTETFKENLSNVASALSLDAPVAQLNRFTKGTLELFTKARLRLKELDRDATSESIADAQRIIDLSVRQSSLEQIGDAIARKTEEGLLTGYERVSDRFSQDLFLGLSRQQRDTVNAESKIEEQLKQFYSVATEDDLEVFNRNFDLSRIFDPGVFTNAINKVVEANNVTFESLVGDPSTNPIETTNTLLTDIKEIIANIDPSINITLPADFGRATSNTLDNIFANSFAVEAGKAFVAMWRRLNTRLSGNVVEDFAKKGSDQQDPEGVGIPAIVKNTKEMKDTLGQLYASTKAWYKAFGEKENIAGFASGGYISGPGGPREDKIPAMLSNGEFVINAAAARSHRGVLDAINSGKDISYFADGGVAGEAPSIIKDSGLRDNLRIAKSEFLSKYGRIEDVTNVGKFARDFEQYMAKVAHIAGYNAGNSHMLVSNQIEHLAFIPGQNAQANTVVAPKILNTRNLRSAATVHAHEVGHALSYMDSFGKNWFEYATALSDPRTQLAEELRANLYVDEILPDYLLDNDFRSKGIRTYENQLKIHNANETMISSRGDLVRVQARNQNLLKQNAAIIEELHDKVRGRTSFIGRMSDDLGISTLSLKNPSSLFKPGMSLAGGIAAGTLGDTVVNDWMGSPFRRLGEKAANALEGKVPIEARGAVYATGATLDAALIEAIAWGSGAKIGKILSKFKRFARPMNENTLARLPEFASGGYISGPGGPKEDKIPAMLSNGEFVVNAAMTKKFKPVLQQINSGNVPGFNGGTAPFVGGNNLSAVIRQRSDVGEYTGLINQLEALEIEFANIGTRIPRITEEFIRFSDKSVVGDLENITNAMEYYKQGLRQEGEERLKSEIGMLRMIEALEKLEERSLRYARKVIAAGNAFAQSIEQGVNNALKGLLSGKSSFKDVGSELLDAFSTSVIDTLVNGITTRLFETEGSLVNFLQTLGSTIFGGKAGAASDDRTTSIDPSSVFASALPSVFSPSSSGLPGMVGGGQSGAQGSALDAQTAAVQEVAANTGPLGALLSGLNLAFQAGFGVLKTVLGGLFKGISSLLGFSGSGPSFGKLAFDLGAAALGFFGGLGDKSGGGGGGSRPGGGMADGGFVSGPGSSRSDSIVARLSNGEYVINAKSAAMYRPLLDQINTSKGYADGGIVGAPGGYSKLKPSSSRDSTVVNVNITGDISRQTKAEIYKMIPDIASGVNQQNREIGY